MKMSLLLFGAILFSVTISAQEKPSAEAEALFKKTMPVINTRHVKWIQSTAAEVNQLQLGPSTVMSKSWNYGVLGSMNDADIEAIAFLVLMQAAKSAQEDLKAIMARVKSINEQKAKQRELLSRLQQQQAISAAETDSFRLLLSRTQLLQKNQNPELARAESAKNNPRMMDKSELKKRIEQLKNDLDSMSEMGEMESLRLQMAMDRYNKMMSTLSNILKKISQTAETITQNLK